jgi:hypothetical protein
MPRASRRTTNFLFFVAILLDRQRPVGHKMARLIRIRNTKN